MTEGEFVVLDELYFVQSYAELQESTALEKEELKKVLEGLLAKAWIRCLSSRSGEPAAAVEALPEQFQNYFYLATKAGLLAHNSR
jgi:hypothetical protein